MFRRFGILVEIDGKEEEKEILINLNHIQSIEEHPNGTFIYMRINAASTQSYKSSIEYKHIADEIGGIKF